jgi:F-type H+-transporting ATPase subunit epsilon
MSFNCVIVTPEQQVLDEQVTQVIFPAYDGKIGILSGRAPLLAKLGLGELVLTSVNNQRKSIYVDGGIAQMKDNRLTVLTTRAEAIENIDVESTRAELAEATARRITDEKTYADRQHAIDAARAKLELAARR